MWNPACVPALVSGMLPGSFALFEFFPILAIVSIAAAMAFVRLYV
jgi:hypothetical protein